MSLCQKKEKRKESDPDMTDGPGTNETTELT